ncbi:protein glass-like isoform X2 [Amphibalanus amphitrite]|uniref:protein glass-like isoform X2 n=1 Tax=Amphibalanus amphitrite TaxID=1232801 RepID=UPI001C90ACD9|nr:protein glass-like isoform X2 [Amphibalanus amphitrite]
MAEMDSYVPNNPHFGYETGPWQPLTPPPPPPPPPGRYGYTGSPEPGPLPGTLAPDPPLQTCHTPDPMINGLSFNALDFEPLPHVYTISSHREFSPPVRERSPTQEMNDFFFPMKHHGATAGALSPTGGSSGHLVSQNSLTPNPHTFGSPANQQLAGLFPPGGHTVDPTGSQMFPSMSVNVSMNMNIGVSPGYHIQEESFAPQLPWSSSPPQYPSGMFSPQPPLVSPLAMPASSATAPYSSSASYAAFTAELRPEVSWTAAAAAQQQQQVEQRGHQLAASLRSSLRRVDPAGYSAHLDESLLYVCKAEPPPPVGQLDKTNVCRVCSKAYARPSTLKTHMRTHSGERPYKCHECNKSFSQAANLTAHVRTHSGEKPFCCPICDRRFSQSSSVTTHMRTHSGDRPYRCRMCKKSFSDSSTLTKHMRIHSGEKPYQCRICMLRFSQSGNLNRHMRVHASSVC